MSLPRVSFSHLGIHVHNMDRMVSFYQRIFGMQITDRGNLPLPGDPAIVFLSRNPDEHHQIALVAGRDDGGGAVRVVNQISFHVDSLTDLRALHHTLTHDPDVGGPTFAINHGMGWSVYSHDPEGNGLEFFVDSPWYVPQPVVDFLDLSLSDDEIRAGTEAAYKTRPGFQTREQWRASFEAKLK